MTAVHTPLDPPEYASFDADWAPRAYLAEYYRVLAPDERETIAFFVEAMTHAGHGDPVLLFGVGPTLHHVFLAAERASEIHLAEYLPRNLGELTRWIDRDPDAHDWRPFVRYTLECEGLARPTERQVDHREDVTRAKITRLIQADARRRDPLGGWEPRTYGTVISAYCADSATGDRATWELFMNHILGLVRPGGTFITAALRRCSSYLVGGKRFPSANVDEDAIRAVLESGFEPHAGAIEVRQLAGHASQGYSSIVLARARRKAESRL